MSLFSFQGGTRPFPQWMGPFSPARGTRSGFRFHRGRLGTWVGDTHGMTFWPIIDGRGAREIAGLVRGTWGGGRVLLLPNGCVIKPLQNDDEVGRRVFIGQFRGSVVLEKPDGSLFDLSSLGKVQSGDIWQGPSTTGLECIIQSDGSLRCAWYHPTRWGREEVSVQLRAPDRSIAAGFRVARPHDTAGRVRITANGHVITNRQQRDGSWASIYVGWVDPGPWADWKKWVAMEDR